MAGVYNTTKYVTASPNANQAGRLSGLTGFHPAKNCVGGSRNTISPKAANVTKLDKAVWATIVAAAVVNWASLEYVRPVNASQRAIACVGIMALCMPD